MDITISAITPQHKATSIVQAQLESMQELGRGNVVSVTILKTTPSLHNSPANLIIRFTSGDTLIVKNTFDAGSRTPGSSEIYDLLKGLGVHHNDAAKVFNFVDDRLVFDVQ